MKKVYFLLVFLSSNLSLSAQTDNSLFDYYSLSPKIGVEGYYGINSNAITNSFTTKFLNGGFIESSFKDKVSSKLDRNNRIGSDINYGIYFSGFPDSLFGKSSISCYFGLRNREHLDLAFSEDLFNLGFYGNKRFAGDTAHLGRFNLNLLRYQQMYFGFIFNKGKYGGGLSILKGEQHLSVNAPISSLYTSPDGTYLDLDLTMDLNQSNTSNKEYWAFNGTGASADFFAVFNLNPADRKKKFLFEVKDLGFIRWNNNSMAYSIDKAYHYEGLEVKNIFQLRDSVFAGVSRDSVIYEITVPENKSYTTILPAFFHIAYMVDLNRKLKLVAGCKYRMLANYQFYSYIKGNYQLTKSANVQVKIAYGGYGNLNFGIGLKKYLGPKFSLALHSDNIEGYVLPAYTTGQGILLSIEKIF